VRREERSWVMTGCGGAGSGELAASGRVGEGLKKIAVKTIRASIVTTASGRFTMRM
jgi:hypothetical protein